MDFTEAKSKMQIGLEHHVDTSDSKAFTTGEWFKYASHRYIWMSCWKSWVVVTNGVPFHIWKVVQTCDASVYVLW